LAQGWLRLFVLKLNGGTVAALYGFMYGKKFYFYQSGFDLVTPVQCRSRYYGLAIEAAIGDGAEEFDLLHGDEKYKSLWAKNQRDLVRMELCPPTSRAWMYTKTITWSRLARKAVRTSLTMLHSPISSEAKIEVSYMKATFKTAASIGIRLTGVDRLVGALTGSSRIPAVISYHRVVENIEESSRSSISSMLISTRMFEQHLDWIGRHYEFISLDDIGSRLNGDKFYEAHSSPSFR